MDFLFESIIYWNDHNDCKDRARVYEIIKVDNTLLPNITSIKSEIIFLFYVSKMLADIVYIFFVNFTNLIISLIIKVKNAIK